MGICIVVVRQTLTLLVGVRFSHPQPRKPQSQLAAVFSGHSAVGSAPRSGRGGRGFKSRCSDQKEPVHIRVLVLFCVSARDLNRAAVRSTANKAIVWLCLARGFHRLGMSNKVHAARSSGICNPKSFDLCSKYDILEKQSHIWLQNGQKSEEKQKLCRK